MAAAGRGLLGRGVRMGEPLKHRDAPGQTDAERERHGQQDAVMAVELYFWKQVGGGNAEEGAGGQRKSNAGDSLLPVTEKIEAGDEQDRANRHRRRVEQVDQPPKAA